MNTKKISAVILILCGLFAAAYKILACTTPPPGPIAYLVSYPEPVFPGESVTLDGSGSWGYGGITKYEWDFDYDGSNFNPDPAHTEVQ